MSFQKDDRVLRLESAEYVAAIAATLHATFGDSRSATKAVARATGANERAVRNWFEAKNGPSGHHLVNLVRVSDPVLEAVLALSGRSGLVDRLYVETICAQLRALLARLDRERPTVGEPPG